MTQVVGSGPFRYVANERVQGARNVYARFGGELRRDRLGDHAAAPHQQRPGVPGRLERLRHLLDRQRLAQPRPHLSLHGNGLAGYPGWSTSERTETLIAAWFDASDTAARQAICRDIQAQCMGDVPFFPLGQYAVTTACRGITGVLKGFPTFWSVRPA